MTVKELIEELQKLPPKYQDANVTTWGEQDLEYINKIEIDSNEIVLLRY